MKFIYKNTEVIALLCIIFYLFFTLVVMYENKINSLKDELIPKEQCILEDSIYFKENENNQYVVPFEYVEKITDGYIKVVYNNEISIIQLSESYIEDLEIGDSYNLIVDKISDEKVLKDNLMNLLVINKIDLIEIGE